MKRNLFFYLFISIALLSGCNNCEKLHLVQNEKQWVTHFTPGQQFYYKNILSGKIDTLEVLDTSNKYTLCNKFELSEYQYETYVVRSVFKSKNKYDGRNCLITLTKNKKTAVDPEIIVAGLGTINNSFKRPPFKLKDTFIEGKRYTALVFFQKDINAEIYGQQQYLKSFYWDKLSGLVAYTTSDNEIYMRVAN
ncbi:MAG: hypothetical protein E6Q58_04155 [Niabella sp.]|nr:MAG: hypothetical protein E6Q58_04155 [Niabella sp.]